MIRQWLQLHIKALGTPDRLQPGSGRVAIDRSYAIRCAEVTASKQRAASRISGIGSRKQLHIPDTPEITSVTPRHQSVGRINDLAGRAVVIYQIGVGGRVVFSKAFNLAIVASLQE